MSSTFARLEEDQNPIDQDAHINLKVQGQVRSFLPSFFFSMAFFGLRLDNAMLIARYRSSIFNSCYWVYGILDFLWIYFMIIC